MTKVMVVFLVIVAIAAGYLLINRSSQPATQEDYVTYQSIEEDISNNSGVLIDVRTPAEYQSGYIKGAKNIPLDTIQNGEIPAVDKSAPVYVYCRSGSRSSMATSLLKQAGFQNVTDLGAVSAVAALGGEIVK